MYKVLLFGIDPWELGIDCVEVDPMLGIRYVTCRLDRDLISLSSDGSI